MLVGVLNPLPEASEAGILSRLMSVGEPYYIPEAEKPG